MSAIRGILSLTVRKNVKSMPGITSVHRAFSSTAQAEAQADENILNPGWPDMDIPRISIPEMLYPKLEKFERHIALECAVTGRKYTFGDVRKKSKNFGKALRKKLGLNEGDVVAVLLPNVPEFPIVALGVLDAGLILTTLNPIYTQEEIFRQLTDSSAKALITLDELWNVASSSVKRLNKQLPILVVKNEQTQSLPRGALDFREFSDNAVDFPDAKPRSPDDVAFMPYSSGTTGMPKGVELTHYNIVANTTQNLSPYMPVVEETTDTHQDIIPAVLPFFHIYGYTVTNLCALAKGVRSITLPKFTPDVYISVLKNHNPHVLFVVPPMVLFLAAFPEVKPEYLKRVRKVFSGAAPLGALDEARLHEKIGNPNLHVHQGYGLTETSPTVTVTPVNCPPGAIGRPVSNTYVKVVDIEDPTCKPLGPNMTGELLVKAPQVMKGYHNRPDANKDTFVDGWLRTGDMVYYNEDKILFVTDRLKELIKVKGFQVPPAELEEIIRDFPNVSDAAVIGIPHDLYGEVPRAYVVPKNGAKIDEEKLKEHVAGKVAHYKKLAGGVSLVQSIPKNASGKILRREIRSKYEKEGV